MSVFVSYSFASMDLEDTRTYFGSSILDVPVVTEIKNDHDKHLLEEQVRSTFGMPDEYRWVTLLDWKWLPEAPVAHEIGGVNITGTLK